MTTNIDSMVTPVLEVGDAATGVTVLVPMYEKMSVDPATPALKQLWQSLGISQIGRTVMYDDSATLANIRRALLENPMKI